MPDVPKLKKKAAELELKKQFDKALAVYVEILDSYENSKEEVDVALYNRVGDIHLKQGNVADAVDYYEKAVDHYIDTGFYNNAIALCNKILRSSPANLTAHHPDDRPRWTRDFNELGCCLSIACDIISDHASEVCEASRSYLHSFAGRIIAVSHE